MKLDTLAQLDSKFAKFPIMCAEESPTNDEVDAASEQIGVSFSSDYREFLLRYGGAMVGAFPIFGLRSCRVMEEQRFSVVDVTLGYRTEYDAAGINALSAWVVFSEDHAGNPIGMDASGKVWIYDHDFGGVTELASDFEGYIRTQCLEVDDQ